MEAKKEGRLVTIIIVVTTDVLPSIDNNVICYDAILLLHTGAHSILGRECDLHTGRFPPVHTGVVLVLSNIGANVSVALKGPLYVDRC